MNIRPCTWIAALLLAASVPAQTTPTDPAAALARAKLLEEREGDLKAAEQAYRALLDDKDTAAVHAEAALRLGSMLWKLDRKDDGKPFLERAVAAGGEVGAQAKAVLQGQGEAEKQAQERLARAQALVTRIAQLLATADGTTASSDQDALGAARRDLAWLGDTAARAIRSHLNNNKDRIVKPRGDERDAAAAAQVPPFVDLLWSIGTAPATAFLTKAAADPSVEWRRMLTRHARQIAPDLFPMVMLFLHDPDPTGEVQHNLRGVLGNLSLGDLQQLTADGNGAARGAGFDGLAMRWASLSANERDPTFAAIEASLRRSLHDPEPRASRAAWNMARTFATGGPRAGRALLLAELASYPSEVDGVFNPERMPLDDREFALLAAAGRALRQAPAAPRQSAQQVVSWFLANHDPEWTAASIDGLIDLVELGLADGSSQQRWGARLFALARPAQLVRFVRSLPNVPHPNVILDQLDNAELPSDAFPALRDVIERCLANPPAKWSVFDKQDLRRQPVAALGMGAGGNLQVLLQLVGKTKSADAAAWLSGLLERRPQLVSPVAYALVALAQDGGGEPARDGLRKLLVWEGTPEVELFPGLRSMLFAELARLGDEPSIVRFPRAYTLGLGGFGLVENRPQNRPLPGRPAFSAKGIGFLGARLTSQNQPGEAVHGYTDAQLVDAWRILLTSDARDEVWTEVLAMRNRIPLQVLPILAAELSARLATSNLELRRALYPVFDAFANVTPEAVASGKPLREAILGLLRHDDLELAGGTFVRLPNKVTQQFADEGHALLRRSLNPGSFADVLRRAGIELDTDDLLLALREPYANTRAAVLDWLPVPLDPALRARVVAMLQDDNEDVRAAVCKTLARLLAADSVAPLLEALRDPSDKVRTAASEALQRIRFHQEQQSFWAHAKAGIDTSPASAAAKLLAQGKPGETKDQRLLAIRSLAVLGAPESLSYLIDWTKDGDAEIATAAREAVATIHRNAGAKK